MLFKNKIMFSLTAKNSLLRKLHQVSGITKMSDLASKPLSKPSKETTSIKNVPSPAMSVSEEKSSRASLSQLKWPEPSSSEEIIFTTSPNTTDMKRDTETFPLTALLPIKSKLVILQLLENADLLPRLFTSTY